MNLDTRLAKLEATHKKILRCLWCRFSLRDLTPAEPGQRHASDDYLSVKCWTCGTPYVVSVAGCTERQREIFKLIYASHPTKQYNDERIHTAKIWLSLSRSQVKSYRAVKRKRRADALGRQRGVSPAQRSHHEMTATQRKEARERELIRAQAFEFMKRRDAQWKLKAKGPDSFPIDETLKELEARYKLENYGEPMKEYVRAAGLPGDRSYSRALESFKVAAVTCHDHLAVLKKREACELVLWGKVESNTQDEIAFFEARLKYLPDIARRAIRREAEEERRQKEERERAHEEYLARVRQQSATVQSSEPETPFEPVQPAPRSSSIEIPYIDNGTVAASQRRTTGQRPYPGFDGRFITEGDERRSHTRSWHDPSTVPDVSPTLPPNDGTLRYQRQKAHYERTGVWLPDDYVSGV